MGFLQSSPPWSIATCLSLQLEGECLRSIFCVQLRGEALEILVAPCNAPDLLSVIDTQDFSLLKPTQSCALPSLLDRTPEKEKSIDGPWCWMDALLVVPLPASFSHCLARTHVGHVSSIGVSCLNFGVPSMCLCALQRH